MNADHRRRIASNDALFDTRSSTITEWPSRSANSITDGDGYGTSEFACECAGLCSGVLDLTPRQYEHARSNQTWFAFTPGHLLVDDEQVIEQHSSHWIVQGAA